MSEDSYFRKVGGWPCSCGKEISLYVQTDAEPDSMGNYYLWGFHDDRKIGSYPFRLDGLTANRYAAYVLDYINGDMCNWPGEGHSLEYKLPEEL